jgi:hypothetical protein
VYDALLQLPKQQYLEPCKSTGDDITYVDTPVTQKGPHIILGCEQLGKTDEIAFILWQSNVLNNRTPVLACKNMGGSAEIYKFVMAITALNDRVSEIVATLRRQHPELLFPRDISALHVGVSDYFTEDGGFNCNYKPIEKFLWRMEQQAQQTERMRPKPIIVLANHAQFRKLADIPATYRSEMELVVDEAHKVHLSADQNLPSERYLFDKDADGHSLIEDMSRAVFVTATAIDLYRIGSSSHNILEMPHPRNHVNWIDGWKQTECFKQFKKTIKPDEDTPDQDTSDDESLGGDIVDSELEGGDSSQPALTPIEFELLDDPPENTAAPKQPTNSNDDESTDTSSDTEEPMSAPTKAHFRQKYMQAHLERFECESVDECDVRVWKSGAKKGLCRIKNGRAKSESVIRDIYTPADEEWKHALRAFRKHRLKSSVRAVNRSSSLMTPEVLYDYVHSIAEKAFAQKQPAAEFRMLVNAHTERNDVKEALCQNLRKAPLLQSTFVFAHYAVREQWTIRLHVPANCHRPFERLLREGHVLFEYDTDSTGVVVLFKTINDVYSVLQHFQRVMTPGEGLRSICIDGKRGVEGVSYRPNDHSGHLTHAFFASSFNKDLTSLKQLLGRVSGIVNPREWTGCRVYIPKLLAFLVNYASACEDEMLQFEKRFGGQEFSLQNPEHERIAPMYSSFINMEREDGKDKRRTRGGKRNRLSSSRDEEKLKLVARDGMAPTGMFCDPTTRANEEHPEAPPSKRSRTHANYDTADRPWSQMIPLNDVLVQNRGYNAIVRRIRDVEPLKRDPVPDLTLSRASSDVYFSKSDVQKWLEEYNNACANIGSSSSAPAMDFSKSEIRAVLNNMLRIANQNRTWDVRPRKSRK